jgi:hypothetical protein
MHHRHKFLSNLSPGDFVLGAQRKIEDCIRTFSQDLQGIMSEFFARTLRKRGRCPECFEIFNPCATGGCPLFSRRTIAIENRCLYMANQLAIAMVVVHIGGSNKNIYQLAKLHS